jgi:transposase
MAIPYFTRMFIKHNVKTDKKTAVQYRYLRLCESYRIGHNTRHRTVVDLGIVPALDTREKQKEFADRVEQLLKGSTLLFLNPIDKEIEALAQKFYKKIKEKRIDTVSPSQSTDTKPPEKDFDSIDLNSIETEEVREVGSEWLSYQAIEQLGIRKFLEQTGWDKDAIDIALIQLVSKAVYPASEHKTAHWIQENSAVAELFSKESLTINRHHLYEASRMLYALKDKLEPFLSSKTNELFDLEDKIILYDLTNTYFEGRKVGSTLAQFGRSKEKRSDARLAALALVTNAQGFVKYSKIYKGNMADCATLEATVTELSSATSQQDRKPLVVMDAGIATDDNLKMLKEKGYSYLCVTRSKLKEYKLVNADQPPIKLYDRRENLIEVQRIEKENSQDAFLYVRSGQKAIKEASMSTHFSERFEAELDALSSGLAKKRATKKTEKIWERIGRIKERYPGANKLYTIDVESKEDKAICIKWSKKTTTIKATDGVYFLRCSQLDLDEKALWNIYNTLTEIEATFRTLKTDLSLRPVYHKSDTNSEAHIFLGVVAYSIVATIRYQLKQKNIHHSWSTIVRKMNTQKIVTTSMMNEKEKKILIKTCSNPTPDVVEIYKALNYKPRPFTRKKFVNLCYPKIKIKIVTN